MADIIPTGDRWEIQLAGHKVGEVTARKAEETTGQSATDHHEPEGWDVLVAGEKVGEIVRKHEGFVPGHVEWIKKHDEWHLKKGRCSSSVPEAAEFVLLKTGAAGQAAGDDRVSPIQVRTAVQRGGRPWLVKILLTAVIGGTLSLCTVWALVSVLRVKFGPLYVATVPGWAIAVGIYLSFDGQNGWRKSIIKGLTFGLTASVLILAVFVTVPLLCLMLLDGIIG